MTVPSVQRKPSAVQPLALSQMSSVVQCGKPKRKKKKKVWTGENCPKYLKFDKRGRSLNRRKLRNTQTVHYPSPPSSPYTPSQEAAIEAFYTHGEREGSIMPSRQAIGFVGEHEIATHLTNQGIDFVDANQFKMNFPGIDFLANQPKPFVQSKYHLGEDYETGYIGDVKAAEESAEKTAQYLFKGTESTEKARNAVIKTAKDWKNPALDQLAVHLRDESLLGADTEDLSEVTELIAANMSYPTHSDHKVPKAHKHILTPRGQDFHYGEKVMHALTYRVEKAPETKKKLEDDDYSG
jgi:hypothetical protein